MIKHLHIHLKDSAPWDDLNRILSQIRNVTVPTATGSNTSSVVSKLQFLKGRVEEALKEAERI